MRFWDSSAVVPLVLDEAGSSWARALLPSDDEIVTWWGTVVECTSAIARQERDGTATIERVREAIRRIDALAAGWMEISPSAAVRDRARRLLRVHSLRAGDALQLAAALVAAEGRPGTLPFVSLDDRQRRAADREGLDVVDGSPGVADGSSG